MNTTEEYSVQELIYLFVDGEATRSEKESLFNSLSKEPELSNEFYFALKMQKAASSEAQLTSPPFALSESLFAKAGLGAITGVAASSAVSSGLLNKLLLSKTALGIISGIMCSTLTFFAMNSHYTSKMETLQNEISNERIANKNSQIPSAIAVNNVSPSSNISDRNVAKQTNFDRNKSQISSNNNDDFSQKVITNNIENNSVIEPIESNPRQNENSPMIEQANERSIQYNFASNQNFKHVETIFEPITHEKNENNIKTSDLIINVGTSQGIGISPNRAFANEKNSSFDNYDCSIMTPLGGDYLIGARVIRENFPIYTKNNSGAFEYVPFNLSYGVNLEKRFPEYQAFNSIEPFATIFSGYSKSGIMMKTELGIIYKAETFLSLKLGLSGSSLMYKELSSIKHTEKIGLIYSIGINF